MDDISINSPFLPLAGESQQLAGNFSLTIRRKLAPMRST